MIRAQFSLIAMIPAMLNLTIITAGDTIAVQICTGDGQVHTVEVPVGEGGSGEQRGLCCAKGCHSGGSRKRGPGNFEPAQ